MKHLLNDLSSEERNRILEQYNNSLIIETSKFNKLMESKLGDVKPLINEQVLNLQSVADKLGMDYVSARESLTKKENAEFKTNKGSIMINPEGNKLNIVVLPNDQKISQLLSNSTITSIKPNVKGMGFNWVVDLSSIDKTELEKDLAQIKNMFNE
jgi:hypothetical protein